MRELKFRIWKNKSGEWLKNITSTHGEKRYCVCDGEVFLIDYNADFGEKYSYRIEDCTIQQYTGLDDKDENPVYEGDIVEFKYQTGDFTEGNGFEKNIDGKTFRGVVDLWADGFPYPSIACETELGKMRFGIVEVTNGKIIGNILENEGLLCEN